MLGDVPLPVWLAGEVPVYTAKGTRIPNERPPGETACSHERVAPAHARAAPIRHAAQVEG